MTNISEVYPDLFLNATQRAIREAEYRNNTITFLAGSHDGFQYALSHTRIIICVILVLTMILLVLHDFEVFDKPQWLRARAVFGCGLVGGAAWLLLSSWAMLG